MFVLYYISVKFAVLIILYYTYKYKKMKNTLLIILLFSSFILNLQSQDSNLWNNEAFGKYTQNNELIDRRGVNEKHFTNENGKTDMIFSSEPMHYYTGNDLKTIYKTITKNNTGKHLDYEYANTHNTFKSYYSVDISKGFITQFSNGATFEEMKNSKMYFETNDANILNSVDIDTNAEFTLSTNKIVYSNVYPFNIDLSITQKAGKRKLDYIINDNSILSAAPANTKYFVFEETVFLPNNYNTKLENDAIIIFDNNNEYFAHYEAPIAFSSPNEDIIKNKKNTVKDLDLNKRTENTNIPKKNNILYEIKQTENKLIIKTKVLFSWLNTEHIVFPVVVDPTLTATHNNNYSWYYSFTPPYGPPAISTSGSPANSYITAFNISYNVSNTEYWWFGSWWAYTGYCGSWHVFDIYSAPTGYYSCGGSHDFNCQNPNSSWRTELWDVDGYDYAARWGYTVNLTYETLDNPTVSGVSSICDKESTTLTASGSPENYEWYDASSGGSLLSSSAAYTTPSLTATSLPTTFTYYVEEVSALCPLIQGPRTATTVTIGCWALPIELLSFDATGVNGNYIKVEWETATEVNNDGFELLRSTDGINFKKITWVKGAGNTTNKQAYSFNDKSVTGGVMYYYKLKQIDFDGKFEEFEIVSANINKKTQNTSFTIQPNPSSSTVTLEFNSEINNIATINIFDFSGKNILTIETTIAKGKNSIKLEEVDKLSLGIYVVQMKISDKLFSKKLVIVH